MTIPETTSARLLFRVAPTPLESARGYLRRVADAHGYDTPQWLTNLAGFSGPEAGIDREDRAHRIAHLLRLEPEEWLAMCYRQVTGPGRPQRSFCGKPVSTNHLNFGKPRVCPACLREHSVWWAVWDLCLLAACPIHRCLLLDQCPGCKKTLARQRPAVHECRCSFDLRTRETARVNTDLVAINAVIYRAAGLSPGNLAEEDINRCDFPPELAGLTLGSLLALLRWGGSFGHGDIQCRARQHLTRTDLNVAIQVGQTTFSLLRNWPHGLRVALKGMVQNFEDAAALRFHKIFGTFYFRLFRGLPRKEFGFVHDVFEEFVNEDWKGLVRGQHRFFSVSTREKSPWIALPKAASEARTNPSRVKDLVRQGQIEGRFFKLLRGRIQCWVKRDSLSQWVTARDTEFGQYISRPEAERILGLRYITLLRIAQAGLIRYAHGSEHGLPHSLHFFFLHEDVMKIKLAFEKHRVREQEYSKPGQLIALGDALRSYLSGDSGLPAAIRAVVDGTLVPVAYTPRLPGIKGYLFPSEQMRLCRHVVGSIEKPPEGFLNYSEAASRLGSDSQVIRALVEHGILDAPGEYRCGHSKLVPASNIRLFSNQYVGVNALARHLHVTAKWLKGHLKKSLTPMLAVPVNSMVTTYFLRKDVAAEVRISPPKKSWR